MLSSAVCQRTTVPRFTTAAGLTSNMADVYHVMWWTRGRYAVGTIESTKKARRLVATTYRLLSRWRIARWAALGMIAALWYTVLVSPPKTQGGPSYPFPQLAPPIEPRVYEDPGEVIGMMRGRKVELSEGYHKRAYVYFGKLAVLITFDTGSFQCNPA